MNTDEDVDPWNGSHADLSSNKLTETEKLWLGREVASRRQTPISLAKRFNLKRNTIQWYGRLVKKGKKPRSSSGRPRKIDNIGLENICSFKKDESDEHLNCLKRQIRLEAKETHERSNSAGNQLDYIKISKRTVGRYTKMVDNVQVTK